MDSDKQTPDRKKLAAFTLPMGVFLFLLALVSALRKVGGSFWLGSPEYWIYPAQTIICGGLLLWSRKEFEFRAPSRILFTLGIGLLVFLLWVAPQQFLGFAPRRIGFDPGIFAGQPAAYWTTIVFRFVRLVVVVPVVEEIFWRGFLLRYLINERFYRVEFGTFSWHSFGIVTAAFAFSHSPADWIAALITGALYNFVAYRTLSLTSCILAHALTNLALGVWIMNTRQWGFW
ncbi:MAG: protease family protein [Verrucomicrobiota bacterium]|jgi:CAAX prenyl protease-like protein